MYIKSHNFGSPLGNVSTDFHKPYISQQELSINSYLAQSSKLYYYPSWTPQQWHVTFISQI